jgi:Cu-Zn family superoxide dismutase
MSFHGTTSILGRGVVVHEKADDLKTQPSGNAGGRLAVGVIGVAKP